MTVTKQLTTLYWGLASDTKPTGVTPGTVYRETDTHAIWITYDGDNWIIADKRVIVSSRDKVKHHYITGEAAISDTLTLTVPIRLLSLSLHAAAALAGTNLTLTIDRLEGAAYDSVDYSYDIATAAVISFLKTWTEKLCYEAGDKLIVAQSNTGSRLIGIDLCYEEL